jgi:quercetin dioxygenase-like cupin family protein
MMPEPVLIDLEALAWTPHPTLAGVKVKLFKNEANFSPADVLIAQVEQGGEIPWHVHENDCEIAYLLKGEARLAYAETEAREETGSIELRSGAALIVPAQLWHTLKNTGPETVYILALHTP